MTSPHYSFSTAHLPPAEQFADFQAKSAVFGFDTRATARPEQQGFRASALGYSADYAMLMECEADGFEVKRDIKFQKALDFDHWTIALWQRGGGDFDVNGYGVRAQEGQLQIQATHRLNPGVFQQNKSTYLILPRDKLSGLELVLEEFSKVDSSRAFHPLLNAYIANLKNVIAAAHPSEYRAIADATAAMVRACTLRSRDTVAAAGKPIAATQLAVAKKLIEAQLWHPTLNAQAIADQMGLSLRKLYMIFEPEGGVDRYMRTLRLNECHRQISQGGDERKIINVVESLGVFDMASFGRQFRAQFGQSPSQVRHNTVVTSGATQLEKFVAGRPAMAGA